MNIEVPFLPSVIMARKLCILCADKVEKDPEIFYKFCPHCDNRIKKWKTKEPYEKI